MSIVFRNRSALKCEILAQKSKHASQRQHERVMSNGAMDNTSPTTFKQVWLTLGNSHFRDVQMLEDFINICLHIGQILLKMLVIIRCKSGQKVDLNFKSVTFFVIFKCLIGKGRTWTSFVASSGWVGLGHPWLFTLERQDLNIPSCLLWKCRTWTFLIVSGRVGLGYTQSF